MTTYPHLVSEYIKYKDSTPFQPLRLFCAGMDVKKEVSMHGKLTALAQYHLRYK